MAAMDLFDEVPAPILVMDEVGRISFANAAAKPLMSRGGLLSLKNGRLTAVGGNSRDWTAALRQAVAAETALLPFIMVQRTSVTTGLVRLRRVQLTLDSHADVPGNAYLALIELRGPGEVRAACVAVAAAFELTPTESLVLRLLAEGGSPKSIALQMAVEVGTVRSHLRSLYVKTGMRRQVELIRLLIT